MPSLLNVTPKKSIPSIAKFEMSIYKILSQSYQRLELSLINLCMKMQASDSIFELIIVCIHYIVR